VGGFGILKCKCTYFLENISRTVDELLVSLFREAEREERKASGC
jgi:hypothetical protein